MNEVTSDLGTGVKIQVLSSTPAGSTTKPPIVFVHGSFHAAWCWSEKWFDYFVDKGYPVAAISLRGTGGTPAGDGVKKVSIDNHVRDLRAMLQRLSDFVPSSLGAKPVLVSHSFGGMAVMKLLEKHPNESSNLSAIIPMCSVPPSGNGPMTARFLQESLGKSYKITVGFALKRCIAKADLCRDLFFGGPPITNPDGTVDDLGVSDADIARYQQYFQRDTVATIDLLDLAKQLPSDQAVEGKAPGLEAFPPCMVIGATDDYIVDAVGVVETATYFGCDEPTWVTAPHDLMLGAKWEEGAAAIDKFLHEQGIC